MTHTLLAQSVLLLMAGTTAPQFAAAQEDPPKQPEPRAETLLLRQTQLRLTAKGGKPGWVRFTYHPRVLSRRELDASVKPGTRWHPGGATWSTLATSHPLQFAAAREGSPKAKRFRVAAGRYVATIQQDRESACLVLTQAAVVDGCGIEPEKPEGLVPLAGYYIPLQFQEGDGAVGTPALDLISDDSAPEAGVLRIRVGAFEWQQEFAMLPRAAPERQANSTERARLLGHLARLDVHPVLRRVLVDPPGQVLALALDPESAEDGKGGERFHGYRILGSREVKPEPSDRPSVGEKLQALLRSDILAHPGLSSEECFEPRHGLRFITDQGPVDLVICFQCSSILATHGKAAVKLPSIHVAKQGEPKFSAQFRKLGLQIAK